MLCFCSVYLCSVFCALCYFCLLCSLPLFSSGVCIVHFVLLLSLCSQSMLWCPLRFPNVWFVFFSVVCFVCLCIGFNGTFNNISVISKRSVLLLEQTGVPKENYLQILSHNVVSSTPCHEEVRTHNISGNRH